MLRRLALIGACSVLAIGVLAPSAMARGGDGDGPHITWVTICHEQRDGDFVTRTLPRVLANWLLKHHEADYAGECRTAVDGCAELNDPKYDGLYIGDSLDGLIFPPAGYHGSNMEFDAVGSQPFTVEVVFDPPTNEPPTYFGQGSSYVVVQFGESWPPVGVPVSVSWSASGGPVQWTVSCSDGS